MEYPPWVFVPGKGYYREGSLVEKGGSHKSLWVTGLVLAASGAAVGGAAVAIAAGEESPGGLIVAYIAAPIVIGVGLAMVIVGLSARREPVYAVKGGEFIEPYEGPVYTLKLGDSDAVAFKVEVTALAF